MNFEVTQNMTNPDPVVMLSGSVHRAALYIMLDMTFTAPVRD